MHRFHQILLVSTFLPLCWLLMQAVHELGHVAGAVATGGSVSKVVLHPLAISRTDAAGSRSPRLVVWAGPIAGVLLPLALLTVAGIARLKWTYLARFFAGTCLIANGAYLGAGSFQRAADAGDLIRYGSPLGHLWLFAVVTLPLGFYLWNGLGPSFGLGPARGRVDREAAWGSAALLVLTLLLELQFSPPC
jgi:hypothetical protein